MSDRHPLDGDSTAALDRRARSLIRQAVAGYDDNYGYGSMSCAIYDTAWVSLVTKPAGGGSREWLFPECFHYLLRTQSDDGSWDVAGGGASRVDGVLNTAAALLALQRHAAEPLQMRNDMPVTDEELLRRVGLATAALQARLDAWGDVTDARHVGFEMIAPALLSLLEKEGITLEFPGHEALAHLRAAKLSRFRREHLYGTTRLTAIHSLEALTDTVDFDRVVHHGVRGSMMGSPSSTAAYLMHASCWDNEAEAYLRHVVRAASGKGNGGVPSAYPSTYFEYTWLLSTLLRAGFSATDLDSPELTRITDILSNAFKAEKGTIGFAPHMGSDVDDTAKGLLSLRLLGRQVDPEPLVAAFEAGSHFRTYPSERDPSLSANCNALSALLHQSKPARYAPQITKIVRFVCQCWWATDSEVKDKWNLCHLYSCMLLIEALADLLRLSDGGALPGLLDGDLRSRVSVAVFQAGLRAMLQQRDDGSWDGSPEKTAYGVLILTEAYRLDLFRDIRQEVRSSVGRGATFLRSLGERRLPPDYVWIEKVTYASPLLTDAYVLGALKSATSVTDTGAHTSDATSPGPGTSRTDGFIKLLRSTPLFAAVPEWQVRASMLEAALFRPLLRARRLDVFPRDGMEEDRYFDIIPLTWTGCNNRTQTFASATFLFEMMVISFLNYQADEFMEAVAGPSYSGDLDGLRELINDLFGMSGRPKRLETEENENGDNDGDDDEKTTNGTGRRPEKRARASNGSARPPQLPQHPRPADVRNSLVRDPLARFVAHVLGHTAVAGASPRDRAAVTSELQTFLLAHVAQTEDNERLRQANKQPSNARDAFAPVAADGTFYRWVRTTSANHTSCPYSFSFVACLLSTGNTGISSNHLEAVRDCFPTAAAKYFAADACRHLATMCRMYNDYGSVARDAAEENLNSVNFAEFEEMKVEDKKKSLFELAEYERGCLVEARRRLEAELEANGADRATGIGTKKVRAWRLFCDVTDLYGQIYVVRTIASRMVNNVGGGEISSGENNRKNGGGDGKAD